MVVTQEPPICDRCHSLIHHHSGVSIQHPTIQAIQDTLFESPHKYNHIYHVIDAADFPMSLIPQIHRLLSITPQRSLNRRSKSGRFYHGKKTEISFIITRSDLLAPVKSEVDHMMPYLVETLRDALGSTGRDVRLGNVRCVSAKRGWWTKEVKEDIWERGGGGWMVGKVNVGKSQLFESVFPKGRREAARAERLLTKTAAGSSEPVREQELDSEERDDPIEEMLDPFALLPPAQVETDYPSMPLVSALPGTTASPIRVPYGDGKGELIDLPGLTRGDLELYVQEEHRHSLVMRSRVVPEQQAIKPGQSLLLGGFIRITPTTPDLVFLSYAFMPISAHLTSTEKAIGVQTEERISGTPNISVPGTGKLVKSAGRFPLKWDVTKARTGPITRPSAAGISQERLPYVVVSTDILIEGCGWVELVAQVRKRTLEPGMVRFEGSKYGDEDLDLEVEDDKSWPEVEVFSPEGRFISARRPMNAWLVGGPRSSATKQRPRKSMRGFKKQKKMAMRLAK